MDLYNRSYEFLKLSIESETFSETVRIIDISGKSMLYFGSGRYFYLKIDLISDKVDFEPDRKSTRLNSSHSGESRMPSSA